MDYTGEVTTTTLKSKGLWPCSSQSETNLQNNSEYFIFIMERTLVLF